MKTCTILNDASSHGQRIRSRLATLAQQSGSELLVLDASRSLEELVARLRQRGCQRVIVAGGDGTISGLVNALAPDFASCQLAVIPAGTGNDLARSLGIPLDSLDEAWRIALHGRCVPIDLGRVFNGESCYFVNAVTAGFGGKVAVDVEPQDKRRWGSFAYWLTAVSELVDLREYRVTIQLDDYSETLQTYGLGIANGRFVGGGFPLAPTAMLNDGLLHVTTVPVLPTLDLLAAGLNFALNRNDTEARVHTYNSSRVVIHSEPALPFSIDGEPTRTMDARFDVMPAALTMVCGSRPAGISPQPTSRQIVT